MSRFNDCDIQTGLPILVFRLTGANLPAPEENGEPRKWLPCEECGAEVSVPLNAVSTLCQPCWDGEPLKEENSFDEDYEAKRGF